MNIPAIFAIPLRAIFLIGALLFVGAAIAWYSAQWFYETACGENGTVDEDPNPKFPPPHCG